MTGRLTDTWWFIAFLVVFLTLIGAIGGAIGGLAVLQSELFVAFMNPWMPNEWNKRELFATGVAGGVAAGYLLMLTARYYRRRKSITILLVLAGFPIALVAGGCSVIAISILADVA